MFVRSENCKYIVDDNDMYNQCKECGSVLAADNGPIGGGGGSGGGGIDFEPDMKYQPTATYEREPLRNVKVSTVRRIDFLLFDTCIFLNLLN